MKVAPKIILASTSPRRVDLMKQMGFEFEAVSPSADETQRKGEKPEALVKRLAFSKALSVVSAYQDSVVIIAADTVVVSPNGRKTLGKPRNARDAEKMLKSLVGKTHSVLSGYCILICERGKIQKKKTRMIRSRVKMRKLTSHEIARYVASQEPMDKAGSYAAQGLGTALVESLNGSYTNVVGLPITQLVSDLEKMLGIRFLDWTRDDHSD